MKQGKRQGGSPPIEPGVKSRPLGIRLTLPQDELLRKLAQERGVKPSQLIRAVLNDFLDRQPATEVAA